MLSPYIFVYSLIMLNLYILEECIIKTYALTLIVILKCGIIPTRLID